MVKTGKLVKTAIATVINYEKDMLKDHWRVNVIVIKKLKKKKQENKQLEVKEYDRKYFKQQLCQYLSLYQSTYSIFAGSSE